MSQISPLEPGHKAPKFTFSSDGDEYVSDSLDAPCLLYFYPKDDTPGCTKQACGIRDRWAAFKKAGLHVVGVSQDDQASHEKFSGKYDLPHPLIPDTDLKLAKAFGVYGEKKFMGKTYDGIHRISFLIDTDETILKTYYKVKPDAHADAVLQDFSQLKN